MSLSCSDLCVSKCVRLCVLLFELRKKFYLVRLRWVMQPCQVSLRRSAATPCCSTDKLGLHRFHVHTHTPSHLPELLVPGEDKKLNGGAATLTSDLFFTLVTVGLKQAGKSPGASLYLLQPAAKSRRTNQLLSV